MKLRFSFLSGLVFVAFFFSGVIHAAEKPINFLWYFSLDQDAARFYESIEIATLASEVAVADPKLGLEVRDFLKSNEFKKAFYAQVLAALDSTQAVQREHSPKGEMLDLLAIKYPATRGILAAPTQAMTDAVIAVEVKAFVIDAPLGFPRLRVKVPGHADGWAISLFDTPLDPCDIVQKAGVITLACSLQDVRNLPLSEMVGAYNKLKTVLANAPGQWGSPQEKWTGYSEITGFSNEATFRFQNAATAKILLLGGHGEIRTSLEITAPYDALHP